MKKTVKTVRMVKILVLIPVIALSLSSTVFASQWCDLITQLYNACYALGSQKDLSVCIQAGKEVYNGLNNKELAQKLSTFCSGVCVANILHKQKLLQEAQSYVGSCQ